MRISPSIRFDSWEFGQSPRQGGGSMTAESPLNAVEPAEESSVGAVNRASSPTSTLVRDEIAERASHAVRGVAHTIEDSARRS
jgi:hypothetical protein